MKDQLQEALDSGYSEQEILNFLKKEKPEMYGKFQEAIKEGYSPQEIFSHLSGKPIQQEQTEDNGYLPNMETLKQVPLGIARIGGRGLSSLVAAPTKGIGGLLQLLSSFGGKNPGAQATGNLGQSISEIGKGGQEQMNALLEQVLGKSYGNGEEAISKTGERAANIYGQLPLAGMAAPAALGGIAGQTAEEMGASPEVQMLAEMVGMTSPELIQAGKSLISKPFTSESGIQLPKIVEKTGEKLRGIKAKVFPGKKEKLLNKINEQAATEISKIKTEQIPIAQEIEKGIDVEARNNQNFENIEKIAESLPNKIESKGISDYLSEVEEKIKAAPVPTEEQQQILKLIEKYRSKYGVIPSGTRFFKPKQYLKQYRNINKDVKNLYETKFVHGERMDTMKFYEGLKNKIAETLETGTPKEFGELFKATNKEFSQIKKLEKFDSIMESFNNDKGVLEPKKLETFLKNPKKVNILKSQIGEEGVEKLKIISKDINLAHKNMGLIDTFGIKDIFTSGPAISLLSWLGLHVPSAAIGGLKGAQLLRGYMLTSPQGARNIQNFLKAVRSGSKKVMIRYAETLNEDMNKYDEQQKD